MSRFGGRLSIPGKDKTAAAPVGPEAARATGGEAESDAASPPAATAMLPPTDCSLMLGLRHAALERAVGAHAGRSPEGIVEAAAIYERYLLNGVTTPAEPDTAVGAADGDDEKSGSSSSGESR
jgi:hypothetical protein